MIRLTVAIFIFISNLSFAADAQERIVIGTQRLSENGALFLAAAEGYFKAEGIDLAMTPTIPTRSSRTYSPPARPTPRAIYSGCVRCSGHGSD